MRSRSIPKVYCQRSQLFCLRRATSAIVFALESQLSIRILVAIFSLSFQRVQISHGLPSVSIIDARQVAIISLPFTVQGRHQRDRVFECSSTHPSQSAPLHRCNININADNDQQRKSQIKQGQQRRLDKHFTKDISS